LGFEDFWTHERSIVSGRTKLRIGNARPQKHGESCREFVTCQLSDRWIIGDGRSLLKLERKAGDCKIPRSLFQESRRIELGAKRLEGRLDASASC